MAKGSKKPSFPAPKGGKSGKDAKGSMMPKGMVKGGKKGY